MYTCGDNVNFFSCYSIQLQTVIITVTISEVIPRMISD